MESAGVVREWHRDEGWGVIDSAETPGGCWVGFARVAGEGYRELTVGQAVTLRWERFDQDGHAFRAVKVWKQETVSGRTRERRPWWRSEDRKALIANFVLMSVVFGVGMSVAFSSSNDSPTTRVAAVIGGGVSGVVFGSIMTVFVSRTWARNGGLRTGRLMQRAYKTQVLPEGIDHAEWAFLLDRHERSAHRERVYLPIFFALATAFYLFSAITGTPSAGLITWLGVALFGSLLIYAPFEAKQRIGRIQRLRAQLPLHSDLGD